jgi:hypothetical protein
MKLEDQVVSLELAKRLKELGVRQESVCYWTERWQLGEPDDKTVGVRFASNPDFSGTPYSYHAERDLCSAFTVAELGEMLPKIIFTKKSVFDKEAKQWVEVEFHHQPNFSYKPGAVQYVTSFYYEKKYKQKYERYAGHQDQLCILFADTEADARAKMLIYLIENKLITL